MTKSLPYLLLVVLFCASGAVPAHEGHDEAEPEAVAQVSPARSDGLDTPQVELVAQREGADIVLYLDDYASNAPLDGLQVSVRSGTVTLQAAAGGDGAYRIASDLIDERSPEPLDISIHGPNLDVQLQAEMPPPAPSEQARQAKSRPAPYLWVLIIALAALAASARRLRRGFRMRSAA